MQTVTHPRETLTEDEQNGLKSYQLGYDEHGVPVDAFRYMEGRPKQYRFDAKDGTFNINGKEPVGPTLTFQPIAWRIFSDNILNMGTKNWVEFFFIDDKGCVSAVLFHGFSVDNLYRLIEPLYYEDLTLADALITVTPDKKENTKIQPKGVYYIAEFDYVIANKELTQQAKDFAADHRIYRLETITDICVMKSAHNYYDLFHDDNVQSAIEVGNEPKSLPAGNE